MKLEDERQRYDKLFGMRLDELRKDRGMTQADLRRSIGVAENTIRGYLQGKVEPTLYIIYRMCLALNCSADELLDPELDIFKDGNVKYARYSSSDFEVIVCSKNGLVPTMLVLGEDHAMLTAQTPYILKKNCEL